MVLISGLRKRNFSDNRAVFVWNTRDWKEKEHKYVRYNVEYDHASLISWSPDSKAFVYLRSHDNVLEVCKLTKRNDGWIQSVSKAVTYPQGHKNETIGLDISPNGKYIMTCSAGTDLILWDLKGSEFTRVDTYLMNNIGAKISPCGTFVAASGFAPDVKIWQVVFAKTGEFKSLSRAFELTGHSSGVYDFAFNADSSLVSTISKDGSWRLYNIKIEYAQGEEPHLIKTGKFKTDGKKACIALSPDGNVIALACGSMLSLVNALTGDVDKEIHNIYSGSITKVLFDAAGEYVLTAGDRHVRVFHNVTGHKTNIQVWKSKLNESGVSLATKERLSKNIAEAEAFLKSIR
ncbi:WD domain, G-beta repeat [Nesidiocoris tenuis]|uniref:WD domain, G-beta repeat n=1 Tax=Nesidiocoris tenuis TaxID=355587 RepID=A0ABN7AUG6_9HEMI|nr:WD domain, G-beta repeat [Nesidiocoris tenuis]